MATGGSGNGALIDSIFHEGSPPNGLGMRCSIVDQFSYGHVKVTSKRMTITPKGIDGKPQRNGNRACGPFVLKFERQGPRTSTASTPRSSLQPADVSAGAHRSPRRRGARCDPR
jgi:hypothetical protein